MTQATFATAADAAPSARPSSPAAVSGGPVKLRRRPALALLGVLLAVSAACVAGWAVLQAQHTVRVLGVARLVEPGHAIGIDDLTFVDVPAGTLESAVRGSDVEDVLGKYATVTLLPGQLVVREALAPDLTPPEGFGLVALAVPAGRMPTVRLEAGDRIEIVSTPSEQDEPPVDGTPESLSAVVVSQEPVPDTSTTIVNVKIQRSSAGLLVARAATGRIALVLLPRDH